MLALRIDGAERASEMNWAARVLRFVVNAFGVDALARESVVLNAFVVHPLAGRTQRFAPKKIDWMAVHSSFNAKHQEHLETRGLDFEVALLPAGEGGSSTDTINFTASSLHAPLRHARDG
jgi:hypothetical protein